MRRMLRFVGLLVGTLCLAGCSHSIHLVHVSGFDAKLKQGTGKVINAKSEQFNIMGFKFDTDYVEQARRTFIAKCPRGQIEGVTTQFSTSHGFFSWRNKILMKGIWIAKS